MIKLSTPKHGTDLEYVPPAITQVVFLPEMFHLNLICESKETRTDCRTLSKTIGLDSAKLRCHKR